MEAYKNIVCATDFSRPSHAAAIRAVGLAQICGATVTLLHVVEYFPEQRSNELIGIETEDPQKFQDETLHLQLKELAAKLGQKNIEQRVAFGEHSAKFEISRIAKELQADLIVIGSHGHHGIVTMLGSTASGLANSAPCDVLIVRVS